MQQNNVDYLKDQIKYTGFGENLSDQLSAKIKQQLETFTLYYQTSYGLTDMKVELYFSRSLTHEMYFFNAYVVNLKGPAGKMTQTFYINKGNSITLKEAYNLMSGRAVHKVFKNKKGKSYTCWVQLDFFNTTPNGNYKLIYYHENYGFNLKSTISRYPILEMEIEEFKHSIIASLKKGNMQMVTFDFSGKEEIRFIEANPKFKSIIMYNDKMEKQFWKPKPSTAKNLGEKGRRPEKETEKKVKQKKGKKVIETHKAMAHKNTPNPIEIQNVKRKIRPKSPKEG